MSVSDPFSRWTLRLVFLGAFLIFITHYGKFVWTEVWPVVAPLFGYSLHP